MKFEEVGRAIDQEMAKLKEFLNEKVNPATRQEMASVLRKTAERLAKLADSLGKAENHKP